MAKVLNVYRGDGLNLYVYVKNNPVMWVDSSGYMAHKKKNPAKEYDIVKYVQKNKGFENYHGIMDAWAKNNIPKYKSGQYSSTTVVLSKQNHLLTQDVYNDWVKDTFGSVKNLDWTKVSPREIKNLSDKMFDAAKVPKSVQDEYYKIFTNYLYKLT